MLSSAEYRKLLLRKKYLSDPEYRAKVLADCKRRREKAWQDRLYREIVRLKDSIRKKRDCIQRRLARVAACEQDLVALVRRRQVVGSQWERIKRAGR